MTARKLTVPAEQPFRIRRSTIQGRGAFATRDIKKGERLIEYVGERISWAESDRRYDDSNAKRHHTFLFGVNKRIVIDAAVDGNDARFINHSCDPNCEALGEGTRIFIYAKRSIRKGDELFYDYAYAREKDTTEEDEKLYVCRCGTAKCRGTILEPRKKARKVARRAKGADVVKQPRPSKKRGKVAKKRGAGQRKAPKGRGAAADRRRAA
jgi:hypothetical protein